MHEQFQFDSFYKLYKWYKDLFLFHPNSNHSTGLGFKHILCLIITTGTAHVSRLWSDPSRAGRASRNIWLRWYRLNRKSGLYNKQTLITSKLKKAEKLENHVWMFDTYEL